MNCPVCKCALIVVERERVELDYCIACHGFWFDAGELHTLAERLSIAQALPDVMSLPLDEPERKRKARPCPRCDKRLDEVVLAGVKLDRCPQGHGLWFDAGELGAVLRQPTPQAAASAVGTVEQQQVVTFLGETIRG